MEKQFKFNSSWKRNILAAYIYKIKMGDVTTTSLKGTNRGNNRWERKIERGNTCFSSLEKL
jgi:hypothetical protein